MNENLPIMIGEEDTLQDVFSKYGCISLDKQESLKELIGEMEGSLDIENAKLTFSDDLVFDVQLIGYVACEDKKWSWAWDNEDIGFPEDIIKESLMARDFGLKYNISQFTKPTFDGEILEGHLMTMTVVGLFGDDAYYVCQEDDFAFFVTIKSDKIPQDNSFDRLRFTFSTFIDNFDIKGRIAFKSYTTLKNVEFKDHEDFSVAKIDDDRLIVGFTDRGNVNLIKALKVDD